MILREHPQVRTKLASVGKFVFYLRQGTPRDLKEQDADIRKCLGGGNWTRLKTYVEPKSHNPQDMKELEKALRFCKEKGAYMIASRIGSRLYNFKMIALLIDAYYDTNKHFRFAACDVMGADFIDLNQLAGMAEARRVEIQENTKKTFAKMKAEGIKLGGPNMKPGDNRVQKIAGKTNKDRFLQFARDMQPIFKQINQYGSTTLKEMADALNARGIPSRYGGQWHPSSVRNVRNKIKEIS